MAKRYAIIADGKVINIVVAETALFSNWVQCGNNVAIGDLYEDGVFSKPEPEGGEL